MNTISKNLNESFKPLLVILVAITIGFTVLPGFVAKARGGDGAAFVGGMIAGSVVKGMVQRDQIRTAAAVEQANNQPRQAAQPQQTAAPQTAQQKLDQLDQLPPEAISRQRSTRPKRRPSWIACNRIPEYESGRQRPYIRRQMTKRRSRTRLKRVSGFSILFLLARRADLTGCRKTPWRQLHYKARRSFI